MSTNSGGQEETDGLSLYRWLRETPSCVQPLAGEKIVYEYSDSLTPWEVSERRRKQARKSPSAIALYVLAGLLVVWYLFSFIYRMGTEENKEQVAKAMTSALPVVGICVGIALLSAFGAWGKLVRYAFSHGHTSRDSADRAQLEGMETELALADSRKPRENAIVVLKNTVIFYLYGCKYAVKRESVFLEIIRGYDTLKLKFTVDGKRLLFPVETPDKEFVRLRKAFGKNAKADEKHKEFSMSDLEIPPLVFITVVLVVSIFLIVAHFYWLPIPLPLALFFLGGSLMGLCGCFAFIPFVSGVLFSFLWSVTVAGFSGWLLVFMEGMSSGAEVTFWHILTHCSPYSAPCVFLIGIGIYLLVYTVGSAIDYFRYGK